MPSDESASQPVEDSSSSPRPDKRAREFSHVNQKARWVRCDHCGEFWCRLHDQHAYECVCPPIEKMTFDPYTEPGP